MLLRSLIVKFFSLTGDEVERVEEFYRERGLFRRCRDENFFEFLFELESPYEEESDVILPPFVLGKFAGTGGQTLVEYLRDVAVGRGVTVSVAESCTGGLIASRITDAPGSSNYFLSGVVAYSNRMKIDLLGVLEESIDKEGAVSSRVAREMAEGIATVSGASHTVAVTGIAGPEGGSEGKPVGTVWFGIRTPDGTESLLRHFSGSRDEIKHKASSFAIFDLVRAIREGTPN